MIARSAAIAASLILAIGLAAQEKLEVDGPTPSTIRLGDTAQVQIRIEGRGANPRTPQLPLLRWPHDDPA